MRIFVAVEISDAARTRAAERIEFLRNQFPNLRVGWERPEKLHLTLKFLGEIEREKNGDLISAIEKAAENSSPFELKIETTGAFPPRGAARVLWLGVTDESGNFRALQKRIEAECAAVGFEREKRDFKPHLTVARLKEPQKSGELVRLHLKTGFDAPSFATSEAILFQSELQPRGSIYTKLAELQLGGKRERAKT